MWDGSVAAVYSDFGGVAPRIRLPRSGVFVAHASGGARSLLRSRLAYQLRLSPGIRSTSAKWLAASVGRIRVFVMRTSGELDLRFGRVEISSFGDARASVQDFGGVYLLLR